MSRGFVSVLGGAPEVPFSQAVLNGWAPDGGMYWPAAVEPVSQATLASWAGLSYPRLCEEVLKRFIAADDPDISRVELASITSAAFEAFGATEIVKLRPLSTGSESKEALHVLELWHGPTLAFKDLGMSVLGRTLHHLLRKRRQRTTLLVGTSGDTGSSAMEAVRGLDGIEIVVLYPLQGFSSISPVQEMQMTAVAQAAPNVHLIGVEGSSDDLDRPMERCFRDADFKGRHQLGSVNSVNVVRLLVQTVHYFYAYCRLARPDAPDAAPEVQFAVPCGAAGHLAAGVLAMQMGLPMRLIAGTNSNDALHALLRTGTLQPGRPVVQTASPSMDIQVPYNVWRILYVASGGDAAAVGRWQADFAAGRLELPGRVRAWLDARIRSAAVDDGATARTMRGAHAHGSYLLDPHTAVGVAAALAAPATAAATATPTATAAPPSVVVCFACAHPVKFLPTVEAAFGCGTERALAMAREGSVGHRCVEAVARMATDAREGYPSPGWVPPGCCAVLRKRPGASADQWEAEWTAALRAKIEDLTSGRRSKL